MSGWNISTTGATVYIKDYPSLGESYTALKLSLRLVRIPDYYITRYVWGVVFLFFSVTHSTQPPPPPPNIHSAHPSLSSPLITHPRKTANSVAMALLVLFVPGDEPDRLGFVQSSFLGIVSWQFILVSSTPVTGYNTKLDNFMMIAMAAVFCTYFWNSVRIGFFDWVQKKHAALFDDGEEKDKGAIDDGEEKDKGAIAPAPGNGITVRSEDKGGASGPAAEVPKRGRERLSSRLYKCCCLKCGEHDLNWVADSAVGVTISCAFVIASAVLLVERPVGCGNHC